MAPVSTAQRDYLDQDPPIRGQNYVCLSFLSPEEAISSREAFAMGKFAERFSEELKGLLGSVESFLELGGGGGGEAAGGAAEAAGGAGEESGRASEAAGGAREAALSRLAAIRERHGYMLSGRLMGAEYDAFVSANASTISKEYSEKSDGCACVRGIKVRGTYETVDEAKHRCESLKRSDPNFSVYVAEVGCWCPWSPNPDELADAAGDQNVAQYSETALNTLMQKYQENVEERDQFYNERKRALMSSSRGAPAAPSGAGGSGAGGSGSSALAGDAAGLPEAAGSQGPAPAAGHEERRSIMAEIEAEDGWSKLKLSGGGA